MSKRIARGGGWTTWNGGDCPVADGTHIEVMFRGAPGDGDLCEVEDDWEPTRLRWSWHESLPAGDIIAYRVKTPLTVEPALNGLDVLGRSLADVKFKSVRDGMPTCPTHARTANEFLGQAGAMLNTRATEYDKSVEEGERSGAAIAMAFSVMTGKPITESEVYLLLQIQKDVRQWTAKGFHYDSALDGVSYSALKAEALAREDSARL